MAQSEVMRELARLRLQGEGWITVKSLERVFQGRLHSRKVRGYLKRLVAYNIVEWRAVSAKLREFRIKKAYLVDGRFSIDTCESKDPNSTVSSSEFHTKKEDREINHIIEDFKEVLS